VKLNTVIFNNTIKAIEKSSVMNKAAKARDILEVMTRLYENGHSEAKADIWTYNGVIRACAYTVGTRKDKKSAFELATSCLHKMRNDKDLGVDLYTYPAIFIACDRLLERTVEELKMVENIFGMCCEDGSVTELVLSHLNKPRSEFPRDFMRVLLCTDDPESITVAKLPKAWSRNTQFGKRSDRRQQQWK